MLAIALAAAGEMLLRTTPAAPAAPPDPATATNTGMATLGSVLVGVAMLLVGLVAWVNDGLPFGQRKRMDEGQAAGEEGTTQGLPVRARSVRTREANGVIEGANKSRAGVAATLRSLGQRYVAVRTRMGWYGTGVGLAVALGLCAWLALILRASWTDPLAGWVWLAIMIVLVVTFAGVKPWPKGASLVAHDPAEPAFEPPRVRAEWIALAVIMVAAVVLRFWHLDSIPVGPYIDESGRALDARNLNYGLPVNRETFVFFGTGWWGVPSFYFWLVAQSMKVFGDNLLGARVIHALAGVGTVWYTYRIGRLVWTPRAGLLAAALLAISDFAIQASRTAGESTITLFFWTACFYYLYKAVKTRMPLDFVLSGLAGGFSLLGYASGKLLPLFLVPLAVYLLLRWRLTGLRRYLPGLALMAAAAAVVALPNLVFQVTQKPTAFTERYNSVTIFTDERKTELAGVYGTDNLGLIVARQFVATYSAYDVAHERGPFYPTDQPVLPLPWAVLWVLGTAYVLWRIGDARYAITACWLVAALAGSAFTVEAPTLQRALMIIPLLALLPAIFLDRVASGVPPLGDKLRRIAPGPARAKRWATAAVIAVLVIVSAFQTLTYYFGPYTAKALYVDFTLAGDYMQSLKPNRDVVYDFGLPVMFGDNSPLLFLGNKVERHDLGNASDVLPITDNQGRDVHFMVSPPDDPTIGLLKSFYPNGKSVMLSKPDGTPVTAVYKVTAEEIDRMRGTSARYKMPDDVWYERPEPRLGTSAVSGQGVQVTVPAGLVYPTTAEWIGGLVSPAYGTYRMRINAPAGATLDIDGNRVLTTTAGVEPTEGRVTMAKGMHTLKLSGTLDSAAAQVELWWGTDNGEMVPVGSEFLWNGPVGSMRGEVFADPDALSLMMPDKLPERLSQPLLIRQDGAFKWSNISAAMQAGPAPLVVWSGTLLASVEGNYYFEAITPGAVTIRIDDRLVGVSNVAGTPNQWPVNMPLAAGEHKFEMRFVQLQDGAPFQLYWQMPGGERALFSPQSLLPAQGGAQVASQIAPAASPDSAVIHSQLQKSVTVAGSMQGGDWNAAMGVAVLPDGRYAVGDSGGHKLAFYDAEGKQYASWGGAATGPDTFNDISDVAVGPGGTIAALDAENGDIRLFSMDGKVLSYVPRDKMGMSHARGLAVGPDGKFYVADTGGSRALRVSPTGDVEVVYRQGNGAIKDLEQPIDVAVAPDGSVYVVDLLKRIVKFGTSGQALKQWQVEIGGARGGSKLALWGDQLVVSNPDGNKLEALDLAKGIVSNLKATGAVPLELNLPTGVAPGPNGELYVVDSGDKRVVRLSEAGVGP
jgi:4-amino-4-deoxy-L-arabinose transferase-like glycosyltransferase/DNA-binding beta-propeller fold protein YncE